MSAIDAESLLTEAAALPEVPTGPRKLRYTHEAMVDQILTRPSISQNELGALFGYGPSWISQILASDAFQARMAERREEIVDPAVRASVEEQFKGLVLRSLDILREKLNRPSAAIPDNLAIRSLELASRALGYGARESTVAVQVNVDNHLEKLGENLVGLLQRKKAEAITEGDFE
jgi:hypothetical protein